MQTFFHPEQLQHHPRSYFSRGQMRPAQEVPERAARLVAAVKSLGFEIREPADSGLEAIAAVHDEAAAMRLQTYRDESRSRHFDLIGGRKHPRSIDLVLVATSGMLSVGFACALMIPFASTISSWIH